MAIYKKEQKISRPEFLSGGDWVIRRLTDVVVLMGKNGSGKSMLLRAWRDQDPEKVHYVIPERSGDLSYQPQYLTEEADGNRRRNTYAGNFVAEYRRRIIGRVQTYFMVRGNFRGNYAPPGAPEELEVLLSSLIPEFSLRLVASNPPYAMYRNVNNEQITQITQLSSGEAQLLTVGLDILTIAAIWEIEGREERVLLIDEPDAHIHPDLQARFADFLCRLSERFRLQLVVATHSTSLMSAFGQFGGEKTSVVYVERSKTEYDAVAFDIVMRELSACLGGHVLMGPLFGAPLLLVEGDDDYRVWSQVPRHHVVNLAVIPCNGEEIKSYQKTLEKMFSSLCESGPSPLGFALLDGDKSLPQPSVRNPQRFVRFLKLNCHELENLYLTDEVLKELGHSWDTAKSEILNESSRFGRKARFLSSCIEWDRQHVDLKKYISELSAILDKKGVAWTTRVGVVIGRNRPLGELAQFLGNDVVDTLWPSFEN